MRSTIIAGNWKMNGTAAETEELIKGLLSGSSSDNGATMIVCPAYPFLAQAAQLLAGSHVALGAQDMSQHEKGAYTGEVSSEMLLTVGVRYVILGHSERRQYHAESDQLVNAKAKAAFSAGLIPIICIGETLTEREADRTEEVIAGQLDGSLEGLTADQLKKSILAYEPVWAIGTGKTATPEMAQAVHSFLRVRLARNDEDAASVVPILYGGSVKPGNAKDLLSQPDIDGALVGGASLKADDFCGIVNAV
ncbi:MAG: triose-phosphate isomerase [candidate division Zixibacteria bacterium]|nr:triose-phosphate isomerase [candidate division Zixibacteria bacterium]MDH3938280.1 triose-phosphate isomerase [candidate division Zixibacteria bacterium]